MAATGTPWCRLYSQFRNSFKVRHLATSLGIREVHARGHLVSLWCWVTDYRPDGNLKNVIDDDIAAAADWDGDAQTFVNAMLQTKWLDKNRKIHNWTIYAESYRRAETKKKSRVGKKTVSVPRQSHDSLGTVAPSREEKRGKEQSSSREELLRKKETPLAAAASIFQTKEELLAWAKSQQPDAVGAAMLSDEMASKLAFPYTLDELKQGMALAGPRARLGLIITKVNEKVRRSSSPGSEAHRIAAKENPPPNALSAAWARPYEQALADAGFSGSPLTMDDRLLVSQLTPDELGRIAFGFRDHDSEQIVFDYLRKKAAA